MSAPVAIALSGGVDSLVSALLLKQAGHDVIGLHFLNGFEPHYAPPQTETDPQHPLLIKDPVSSGYEKLHADLHRMVARLKIPVTLFDCAAPFRSQVIRYFKEAYRAGETPNPCMVCNRRVKFGIMLTAARDLGARHLATGHYVRTRTDPDGQVHLLRGTDSRKDQAYFLARLQPEQLAAARFPLGEMRKSAVKALAAREGLHPLAQKESQDVCFIGESTYGKFLADNLGLKPAPGDIEDRRGKVIGRHDGLHLFTIGQRRGINCPSSEPYYVCALDTARNVLVVGRKADLYTRRCRVDGINWIIAPKTDTLRLQTRVRYRSPAAASSVTITGPTCAKVDFDAPQSAVTPGQGAVFYRGDEILGGGWITGAA
jgi:tRNA-specific 2-thiouridylase